MIGGWTHARLAWLHSRRDDELVAWLEGDPENHDAKAAGWWLYVMACGIGDPFGGGPWVVIDGKLANSRTSATQARASTADSDDELPHLGDAGRASTANSRTSAAQARASTANSAPRRRRPGRSMALHAPALRTHQACSDHLRIVGTGHETFRHPRRIRVTVRALSSQIPRTQHQAICTQRAPTTTGPSANKSANGVSMNPLGYVSSCVALTVNTTNSLITAGQSRKANPVGVRDTTLIAQQVDASACAVTGLPQPDPAAGSVWGDL